MRKVFAVVISGALVLAGNAAGKTASRLTVCGVVKCRATAAKAALPRFPIFTVPPLHAPHVAPYYRIAVDVHVVHSTPHRMRLSYLYVPSLGVLAENGETGDLLWWRAYKSVVVKVKRLARGLQPFRAPRKWPSEVSFVRGRMH